MFRSSQLGASQAGSESRRALSAAAYRGTDLTDGYDPMTEALPRRVIAAAVEHR